MFPLVFVEDHTRPARVLGWFGKGGRDLGSKYWTAPGRLKGEMTEDGARLPAIPASGSGMSASMAPDDDKGESEGSLVGRERRGRD